MKITHEPILKRLNHKWATEVRDMPRFRGDRNLKPRLLKHLRNQALAGCFHGADWAIVYCKETGLWYRINGQHTSTVFSDPEIPVAGIKITLKSWTVDTLVEVAELYETFDYQGSSRNTGDIVSGYASALNSLDDVNRALINRCVNGCAYATYEYSGATKVDISTKAKDCIFDEESFIHFVNSLCFGGKKLTFFTNAPILSVVFRTYKESPTLAKIFWDAVRDGSTPDAESPDRVLQLWLANHKIKSGKGAVDPDVLIKKATKLWYAWKERQPQIETELGDMDLSKSPEPVTEPVTKPVNYATV